MAIQSNEEGCFDGYPVRKRLAKAHRLSHFWGALSMEGFRVLGRRAQVLGALVAQARVEGRTAIAPWPEWKAALKISPQNFRRAVIELEERGALVRLPDKNHTAWVRLSPRILPRSPTRRERQMPP